MTDEPYDGELDNVILAYLKFAPPRPVPSGPIHFTLRQRVRIKRSELNRRLQQWIHDHLSEARCDQ